MAAREDWRVFDTTAPSNSREPAEATAWAALTDELDRWSAGGLTATFWWRDDDAGRDGAPLERLLGLRRSLGIDLALAAVPTWVDAAFRARLAAEDAISVLQHGYSHHNFAAPDERKIELDGSRPAEYVIADLAVGQQTLASLPGWLPVLVPPWNRIAPHLVPPLPELGFVGLSGLGARPRRNAAPGLRQNNVHIDPVDWRGRAGPAGAFAGADRAIAAAVAHLAARREGSADRDEATGLMTHHAVQDEATWEFCSQFVARTKRHPAAAWLAAANIFAGEQ